MFVVAYPSFNPRWASLGAGPWAGLAGGRWRAGGLAGRRAGGRALALAGRCSGVARRGGGLGRAPWQRGLGGLAPRRRVSCTPPIPPRPRPPQGGADGHRGPVAGRGQGAGPPPHHLQRRAGPHQVPAALLLVVVVPAADAAVAHVAAAARPAPTGPVQPSAAVPARARVPKLATSSTPPLPLAPPRPAGTATTRRSSSRRLRAWRATSSASSRRPTTSATSKVGGGGRPCAWRTLRARAARAETPRGCSRGRELRRPVLPCPALPCPARRHTPGGAVPLLPRALAGAAPQPAGPQRAAAGVDRREAAHAAAGGDGDPAGQRLRRRRGVAERRRGVRAWVGGWVGGGWVGVFCSMSAGWEWAEVWELSVGAFEGRAVRAAVWRASRAAGRLASRQDRRIGWIVHLRRGSAAARRSTRGTSPVPRRACPRSISDPRAGGEKR
jgi:hypothetical protein